MNPQLLLKEIATGAVAASSSGHRVVNHVPYTEYIVSVDLQRALAAAGKTGALRIAMQQELSALPAGRGSLIRVVARIDGNGRLAQLQASPPGANLGTVQITLWRFGTTIPLSLPLTTQTADIASLRRSHKTGTAAWVFTGE